MQIKNVTLSATTETEITIEQGYPYVWFKNLGDNTVYVSASPDILDNGSVKTEGVSTITSGECTSVTTKSDKVYAYALGATIVEVHAQGNPESSFKIKAKGGGTITIDDVPTQGSTNAVSSGGTYTAIQAVKATRTLLYTSGDITTGAPYQTDVNLLDNLNKYDIVMILYVVDSTTGAEKVDTGVYDVQELITSGYDAYYAGYFCRWSSVSFTNTTFNQTGRGATNEGDQFAPQIYKIYGYKL